MMSMRARAWFFSAQLTLLAAGAAAQAAAPLPKWTEEARRTWWAEHDTPEQWREAAPSIREALLALQRRHGIAWAMRSPDFKGWVRHLHWLTLFPEDWREHDYFRDPIHQDAYRRLSLAPRLPGRLLAAIRPEDDAAAALEILCRIRACDEDRAQDYANLAVALAVVLDQPPPAGWPHPYVRTQDLRIHARDPCLRFAEIADANEQGILMLDPRNLPVSELLFVVDSWLDPGEVRFARRLDPDRVRRLTQLYDNVPYSHERTQRGEYVWAQGPYRLPEIAGLGGICADRAYYTAQVGKAFGIPTLLFLGQGRDGTHAWVGYSNGRGAWTVDVARYQTDVYPVGRAFDPQTWRRISDSDVLTPYAYPRRGRGADKAAFAVEWARMNPEAPFYRDLLAVARSQIHHWLEPWRMEAEWLQSHPSPPEVRASFWRQWIHAFHDHRDLRFEGQKNLLSVLEEAGDAVAAGRLREQILAENRGQRFDLAIGLVADEVMRLMERQEWPRAEQAFQEGMHRFEGQTGGHLFYSLLLPYVHVAVQHGRTDLAVRATKFLAQEEFPVRSGSILDTDIQRLIRQVAAVAETGGPS